MRVALLALAACAAAHPRPRDGAIGGLVRDRDSGDPVGSATIRLRGTTLVTTATREGLFGFDHLAAGRYNLDADQGSARGSVVNIDVVLGEATVVDVELAHGGSAAVIDFTGDTRDDAIEHYTPAHHDPATAAIDGTVTDLASRRRIAGAVVTAVIGDTTLQAVSDDAGRYRFDPVTPGTYTLSAYYSVYGHAQIEVRRSAIEVAAGHGVRVPLWIETQQ